MAQSQSILVPERLAKREKVAADTKFNEPKITVKVAIFRDEIIHALSRQISLLVSILKTHYPGIGEFPHGWLSANWGVP